MKYWHISSDTSRRYKGLYSDGPVWPPEAYYEEGYISPTWGKFDPSREAFFYKNSERRLPAVDISMSAGPLSCSRAVFALFSDLLGDFVAMFPLCVDHKEWVTFRPTVFLNNIDMTKSDYLRFEDGEPYGFRHIILRSPPDMNAPIFGFSHPETARFKVVVSDQFKDIFDRNKLKGVSFFQAFP